jgi:dTDP-4-amino-4,6-dideoxygalactose transaminase
MKIIRLSKSCLGTDEKKAAIRVLDNEFLGMGLEVRKFENELEAFFNRPVVCVSTGTAALHLALQAIGVGNGDEVLVQSLTYVASFQAISATGAKPVACDIDSKTLCLNWRDAEKRITPQTKAIMPVHYSGGVGALHDIYAFAEKHGLRVIEDAAHAFGSRYKDKRIGSFGDVACFSFDGIKNITSGEGGCIVTDDQVLLDKVRDARLLGVEKDTDSRFLGKRSWDFDVTAQGWRYHMSNIMAAIGLEQLKRFPELSAKRKSLARLFDTQLSNVSGIELFCHNYDNVTPHIYVIKLQSGLNREKIREKLEQYGIQTGIHYKPNHHLSLYQDASKNLYETDKIYPRILSLPLHPDLSEKEIKYVCEKLIETISGS